MLLTISELKFKFVRWLLDDKETRRMVVETIIAADAFHKEVEDIAADAAEDAVTEHENEKDHEFVSVEDLVHSQEFDQAVTEAVGTFEVDANDVENLEDVVENFVQKALRDGRILVPQSAVEQPQGGSS